MRQKEVGGAVTELEGAIMLLLYFTVCCVVVVRRSYKSNTAGQTWVLSGAREWQRRKRKEREVN